MIRVSRRALLGTGLGLGALGAGLGFTSPWSPTPSTGRLLPSRIPLPEPFTCDFRTPPVLTPRAAHDRLDITARQAEIEILPGRTTNVWAYNGILPGPTLETSSGQPLIVRHANRLPVPTAVHLHGGHTPASSDGYATDLIMPPGPQPSHGDMGDMPDDPAATVVAGHRDYHYPQDQRAATLWYHDHRMGFTGPAVWRGLAGVHIIRDSVEDNLPLPRDGQELLLVLSDRSFGPDGELLYPSLDPTLTHTAGVEPSYAGGVLGDVVLVNGVPNPRVTVQGRRHRLRLLNASNARRYRLTLDPAPPDGSAAFLQIGSDAGLLEHPQPLTAVEVAGGQRFDVIVDFSTYPPGSQVILRNTYGDAPHTANVTRFDVGRRSPDDSHIPQTLSHIEWPDPSQAEITRTFLFRSGPRGGWTINGQPFDPSTSQATPRVGATEIWQFITDLHHPLHLHLAPMRVLGRGLNGPGPTDTGLKDTIDARPAERLKVAIRFNGSPGRYLFHCHNLEHEDMAMMANFTLRS